MTPDWIIAKKRDGDTLSDQEIYWVIAEFAVGRLPDYQMAALAMAIYLRGMSAEEVVSLTEAMLASGTRLAWPDLPGPTVDKHSTGGIGDKTSIILAPLLASCGLFVPMISGRGLGATGGTLDKLESIPGFRADLSIRELQSVVRRVGCAITGATDEIAPADRELYALRDVTATVASIPLITASILSKKLAEGIEYLVLDVKYGSGAFMKNLGDARRLATSLTEVGSRLGLNVSAVLSDMNQPLGCMVGNALEIKESIEVLQGTGPTDTTKLTLELSSQLMVAARVSLNKLEAIQALSSAISSGSARQKYDEMVSAQGGDPYAPLPLADTGDLCASRNGFVTQIETEMLGRAVIELGGGRKHKGDRIDHSVGFEMRVRVGDWVEQGQPYVTVYAHPPQIDRVRQLIEKAVVLDAQPPAEVAPLIGEWVHA
ncbi:MAG: thymidine phosphorylase [Planctomycetota bacterium]|nr:thymidine phosphorylase [Planctomycetota bacterium]